MSSNDPQPEYEELSELKQAQNTLEYLLDTFGNKLLVQNYTEILTSIPINIILDFIEDKGYRLYHQT